VHDIGVTWYECPEPNCSYKAKVMSSICTKPACMASASLGMLAVMDASS